MYPSDEFGGIASAVPRKGEAAAAVPTVPDQHDVRMLLHLGSPSDWDPQLAMKKREGDESGGWVSREEREEDQGE